MNSKYFIFCLFIAITALIHVNSELVYSKKKVENNGAKGKSITAAALIGTAVLGGLAGTTMAAGAAAEAEQQRLAEEQRQYNEYKEAEANAILDFAKNPNAHVDDLMISPELKKSVKNTQSLEDAMNNFNVASQQHSQQSYSSKESQPSNQYPQPSSYSSYTPQPSYNSYAPQPSSYSSYAPQPTITYTYPQPVPTPSWTYNYW
ncbi:hypothetical protein SNEBB_010194 [Seison nebaliae]|nr:hypothetical protein SNEBB_010194 [Seison nebaliae]